MKTPWHFKRWFPFCIRQKWDLLKLFNGKKKQAAEAGAGAALVGALCHSLLGVWGRAFWPGKHPREKPFKNKLSLRKRFHFDKYNFSHKTFVWNIPDQVECHLWWTFLPRWTSRKMPNNSWEQWAGLNLEAGNWCFNPWSGFAPYGKYHHVALPSFLLCCLLPL